MRNITVTYRDIFSPTEIPHVRHEQGRICIKWLKVCGNIIGIEIRKFSTIVTPYITVNLKADLILRKYPLLI